jgi:hypothetical protein
MMGNRLRTIGSKRPYYKFKQLISAKSLIFGFCHQKQTLSFDMGQIQLFILKDFGIVEDWL